jgi:hypothetical protein
MSNQNNKIIIISISLLFLVVVLSALFVCSSSGCQIGVKQPGNNSPRNMQMDKPMGMPAGKEMDKPKGIILVNGEGMASDKPNIVSIRVDIRAESESAEEATRVVAGDFDRLVKSLGRKNIGKNDIVSNNFDLGPVYYYPREGPPVISGYRATHSVTITKQANPDDIGKEAGEIIDVITDTGINDISLVQFLLDEKTANELKKLALENAVENAKDKAGTLAKASDVELGEVVAVSESAQFSIAEPRYAMMERADVMMSTELVAGNYDVTASVQVKFRIV